MLGAATYCCMAPLTTYCWRRGADRAALLVLQASVAQCALILASALVFWAFRSDQGGGGYSYF